MKVAFIGRNGHQGYLTSGLSKAPDCAVVGIARSEPDEDMSGFLADHADGPRRYDDYRKMLDKEKPDVVGLAPAWRDHQRISVECLERDINVMCEKPVAFTLEDLSALRKAYEASKGDFIGMHGMRYAPNFYAGRHALREGLIGRPILITGQKSYAFSLSRPHFYKRRETYGGTICWVAIHAIDWTYWMAGGLETLYAAHTRIGNMDYGECESSGVIAFALEQGGTGCINFDFLKAHKDPDRQDRCRIAGENGVIEIKKGVAILTTHNEEPRELGLAMDRDFFVDWIASIRGEGTCELTAEDTFEVTRLALLARESADTQTLIRPAERPLA